MPKISLAFLAALAACGGSEPPKSTTPPGDTHATAPPPAPAAPDVAGEPAPTTAPQPEEKFAPRPPAPKAEGRSIELKNDGDGELAFGTTKGWGLVVIAYSGKPPKAKSVQLFESYCTASCAAPDGEICPVCKEPKNKKEELAMSKTETAAPGGSIKVPWDGKVFVYEKTKGKHHCKCWNKVDPPAETFTVRACGRRPAKEPGKPSKPACAQTEVPLGPEAPQTITLSFK